MSPLKDPVDSIFHLSLCLHNLNKAAEKKAGISLVQWCLLRNLVDMPAASAQDLARALKVHPSSLTQGLKRLTRKDLLFITEDPRDKRRKVISLTRKGKQALDGSQAGMAALLAGLESIRGELGAVEQHLSALRPLSAPRPFEGKATQNARDF